MKIIIPIKKVKIINSVKIFAKAISPPVKVFSILKFKTSTFFAEFLFK